MKMDMSYIPQINQGERIDVGELSLVRYRVMFNVLRKNETYIPGKLYPHFYYCRDGGLLNISLEPFDDMDLVQMIYDTFEFPYFVVEYHDIINVVLHDIRHLLTFPGYMFYRPDTRSFTMHRFYIDDEYCYQLIIKGYSNHIKDCLIIVYDTNWVESVNDYTEKNILCLKFAWSGNKCSNIDKLLMMFSTNYVIFDDITYYSPTRITSYDDLINKCDIVEFDFYDYYVNVYKSFNRPNMTKSARK